MDAAWKFGLTNPACSTLECQWKAPPTTKNLIKPQKIRDMKWCKHKFERGNFLVLSLVDGSYIDMVMASVFLEKPKVLTTGIHYDFKMFNIQDTNTTFKQISKQGTVQLAQMDASIKWTPALRGHFEFPQHIFLYN